jgi:hypothetical protein
MLKTVTCGETAVLRAANAHGIRISFCPIPPGTFNADVHCAPTGKPNERALSSRTLAGELFLSLLVAGATL